MACRARVGGRRSLPAFVTPEVKGRRLELHLSKPPNFLANHWMQGLNIMSRMVEYSWRIFVNGGQCRPSMIGASGVPLGATSIAGSKSYAVRTASFVRRSTMCLQIFASLGSSRSQSERRKGCFGRRGPGPPAVCGGRAVNADSLSKRSSRTKLVKCVKMKS